MAARAWHHAETASAKAVACENASIHNPTAKLTQHIDFVRKNEISEGSFSRET